MTIDRIVFAVAGAIVLLSVGLAVFHDQRWLWLTALVGANMLQSAFTGFCPLAILLRKLGRRPGPAFQ